MIPLWALVALPIACAVLAALLPRPRAVLSLGVAGSLAEVILFCLAAPAAFSGQRFAIGRQLLLSPFASASHKASCSGWARTS